MTVKSIIDVDIKDEAFKTFLGLFNQYKEEVAKMPEAWAKVGDSAGHSSASFGDVVAAMMAQAMLSKKLEENEHKRTTNVVKEEKSWKNMVGYTKSVASNLATATKSLLRWTSITGIISGLIGGGGLLGIDELALSVGADRKSALGLGTTIGEHNAFNIYGGNSVDPQSFLSGINQSLHDVTQRRGLYSLGISQIALSSNDAVQVGTEALTKLKDFADRMNPAAYQQAIDAYGLGGITSTSDLERLHKMSRAEVVQEQQNIRNNAGSMGPNDADARKWQALGNQLEAAEKKIKTVFVDGLTPLTQPLSKLSDAFANALAELLKSIRPSDIKSIGDGITDFSKYIGSTNFRNDLRTFTDDVSYAAHKIVDGLKWLDLIPDKSDATPAGDSPGSAPQFQSNVAGDSLSGRAKRAAAGAVFGGAVGGLIGGMPGALIGARVGGYAGAVLPDGSSVLGEYAYPVLHPDWGRDPTSIKWPKDPTGKKFAQFNSPEAGIRATLRQLALYENRDHIDTVEGIISRFAPKSDKNDTAAYISYVAHRTGLHNKDKLNLNDIGITSKFISALVGQEGHSIKYTPAQIQGILKEMYDTATPPPAAHTGMHPDAKAVVKALAKKPPTKLNVTITSPPGGNAIQTTSTAGGG